MIRVTEALQSAGLIDFSRVREDIMERAQAFGTAAHKACELHDKGSLNFASLSGPLIPYLEGWKKFLKDYNITIDPNEMEKRFVSKKWGFSGTPDRWPLIGRKRTVVDIKTCTVMYAPTAIQTAGYQILLEETGIKIHQRWGVQLNEKGTYKVEPYTDPADRTVFLSCLNVCKWKGRKL